ncbi:MAG: hypothetical protein R3219_08085, partial [Hydrogenovibrio sp.]|nr:hypothetical protein [Hydrogenovibrio sp.]
MVARCLQKRFALGIFTLVLWGLTGAVSVQAKVSLYPQNIVLGESVTLILSGSNIEKDFTAFDKSKIRAFFEIYDVEGDQDRIRLELYPRKVGVAKFPPMHIGKLQFAGATVTVKPNPDVSVTWLPPAETGYMNQLQSWTAEVKTSDSGLRVKLQVHPHANPKVKHLFKPLALETPQQLFGQKRVFQMLIGGEDPGKLKVRSPIIEVKHSGNNRPWLFFDHTRWLQLKPLPSFLPVSMPVGRVSLSVPSLDFWQVKGRLLTWSLSLKGQNVEQNSLPDMTHQLIAGTDIEWLTPDVEKGQQWTTEGLVTTKVVKQPFRLAQLGFIQLPGVRVTYFDPNSGKLVDQFVSGQWLFSVPRWLYWLMNTVFYALLGGGLGLLFWILIEAMQKYRLLWRLTRAKDNEAVWRAIQGWTHWHFGSSSDNLTFGQWRQAVENRYDASDELFKLVNQLDRAHFSELSLGVQDSALNWA